MPRHFEPRNLSKLQSTRHRIYPILIESEQWRHALHTRLDLNDILELAIRRSLENCQFLISNKNVRDTVIREGLAVIIFDGFDELCLHPQFEGGPEDIINEFVSCIKTDSDNRSARILLTTREAYWYSIPEVVDYQDNLETFRLLGFSNKQKQDYLRKYFQGKKNADEKIDTALRISSQVGGRLFGNTEREGENAERLSGTPLILHLIAVALESGVTINPYAADPLNGILLGVCKREIKRQKLLIDENKQMEIFEELFISDTHLIRDESIELCLRVYAEKEIDEDDTQIDRFRHHFFFIREKNGNCVPRYEMLRTYFISRFLAQGLLSAASGARKDFVGHLAKNARVTGAAQITDWLVVQLRQHKQHVLIDAFQKASEMLLEPEIMQLPNHFSLRRRAGQMLLKVVLQLLPSDIDKTSKRVELARYLSTKNESQLSGMHFCDVLDGFDFCGCTFSESTFFSVTFKNCIFDESTVIDGSCNMDGDKLDFHRSTGHKHITFDESCQMSPEVDHIIAELKERRQSKSKMEILSENAVKQALFMLKGRPGSGYIPVKISRIEENRNPYSKLIWKELEKANIIYKHTIDAKEGRGDAYSVSEDKDVREELRSYFDNSILGKRLSDVKSKLLS